MWPFNRTPKDQIEGTVEHARKVAQEYGINRKFAVKAKAKAISGEEYQFTFTYKGKIKDVGFLEESYVFSSPFEYAVSKTKLDLFKEPNTPYYGKDDDYRLSDCGVKVYRHAVEYFTYGGPYEVTE